MTGVSMNIVGMASVRKSTCTSCVSSVEMMGKASVESDGSTLEIVGKAVVKDDRASLVISGNLAAVQGSNRKIGMHVIHCTWTKACLASAGIGFWCAVLLVRFIYLWQQCLMRSGESTWSLVRASFVLGTEVGLLVMAVLLLLLVPRMIVTWTTALVFDYIMGSVVTGKVGKRQIVKDGTKNAKEISWITLTGVFEEGNAVAAAVLIVCFMSTVICRHFLSVSSMDASQLPR